MPRRKKIIDVDSIKNEEVDNRDLIRRNYYKCDVCSSVFRITPVTLNLTYFTGLANYYRKCSLDKLKLCANCSKEINTLVDNWIVHKNPSLEKFK